MDEDLKAFLTRMVETFTGKLEEVRKDMDTGFRDIRGELRDIREEMRTVKDDRREMHSRIDRAISDYQDARRLREIRVIGLEARVDDIERRLGEKGL